MDGERVSFAVAGLVVAGAQLLPAVPGDLDSEVAFVGCPGALEPDALPIGEVFLACSQQVADPVERVALAAPVAMDLLLHAASHVVVDLPYPAPQLVAVDRHLDAHGVARPSLPLDDAPHVRIPELEPGVTSYPHLLGNDREGLRV